MNVRRTGGLVAIALAAGIAIGGAGSAIAASPTPSGGGDLWSQMSRMMQGTWPMSGAGMMGGAGGMVGSPNASFGPGMMGNLSPADRQALLERCDELHDAMHAAAIASPAPSNNW